MALTESSGDAKVPAVQGTNSAFGVGMLGVGKVGLVGASTAPTKDFSKDFFSVGVQGLAAIGVSGEGTVVGVAGHSDGAGVGVSGNSSTGVGVTAEANLEDALRATTKGIDKSAVFAVNNGQGDAPTGGPPGGNGVFGLTTVRGGAGVFGSNNSAGPLGRGVQGNGPEAGVGGFSDAGSGVLAQSKAGIAILAQGGKLAGRFEGNVEVTGVIACDGDIALKARDVAEYFESAIECVAGSVMVLEEGARVRPCMREYDKRAVGVISGAGDLRPAIVLGKSDERPPLSVPIAMVGTAFCLVDADKAAIEAGDLLTSSDTPGHGMKALDQARSFGAVIGKALASLRCGRGLIPIIVALQ